MRPAGSRPIGKALGGSTVSLDGGSDGTAWVAAAPAAAVSLARCATLSEAFVSHSRSGVVRARVEQHQPLDRGRGEHGRRYRLVGFTDGVIQRFVMDVIEPGAVVDAVVGTAHSRAGRACRKRRCTFAAVRDAGKARVLPFDAHAGMPHHKHQEPRLTLGEAVLDDGLDAFCASSVQELLGQAAVATSAARHRRSAPLIRRLIRR